MKRGLPQVIVGVAIVLASVYLAGWMVFYGTGYFRPGSRLSPNICRTAGRLIPGTPRVVRPCKIRFSGIAVVGIGIIIAEYTGR
jgi:hypothetical protein